MQELKINNLEIQYNGIDEIKLSFFLEISIKKNSETTMAWQEPNIKP